MAMPDKSKTTLLQTYDLRSFMVSVVATSLTVFHIYTGGAGQFPDLIQRAIHVGGALALTFLLYPSFSGKAGSRLRAGALSVDISIAFFAGFIGLYILLRYDTMTTIGYYASSTDLLIGALTVVVLLEAARRVVGLFLPILSIVLILYSIYANLIPGMFGFSGLPVSRVVEILFTTQRGVWGEITGISATVIAVFVIFGSILFACGGGTAFLNIALWLGGRSTGGAAKVAVVASGLFGSLSGSAAANVATTGSFTIPMMTRLGYKPQFASAVEAVASSGGQLLPPIMGAGAFVMAELLGISYGAVAAGALLPALLFYGAVFVSTHFESERLGYTRVPENEILPLKEILAPSQSLPLFVPLIILVTLMLDGYTPTYAGFWAIISAITLFVVTQLWVSKGNLRSLLPLLDAFVIAGKGLVTVGVLIACAQIVVALIATTGIGVKVSLLIVSVGGGSLALSLILAMCLAIVLGMGLPTTAAYLLAAAVVAPALAQLGISGLAAHLFIFYFAILAGLTPPVCAAIFIAAAIAKTPWTGTLKYAFRLALPAFFIPYLFVEHRVLLLEEFGLEGILRLLQVILFMFSLSIALVGNFRGKMMGVERLILLLACAAMLNPENWSTISGAATAFLILGRRVIFEKSFSKLSDERTQDPSAINNTENKDEARNGT